MEALRLGILVADGNALNTYRHVVAEAGNKVVQAYTLNRVSPEILTESQVDAWLVNLDSDSSHGIAAELLERIESTLLELPVPVIYQEGATPTAGSEPYTAWVRRLLGKLSQLPGHINLSQSGVTIARQVWVLAASTGGPEAVVSFLQQLPAGIPVAFIYAQHIEPNFETNLVFAINRRTKLKASVARHGDVLQAGTVVLMPVTEQFDVASNGTFKATGAAWQGDYTPSADQVIANIGNLYGNQSGVVVFSGMGNDGARGCEWLKSKGGKVWLQRADTCTVSSMVDAVRGRQVVIDNINEPEILGQQFAKQFQMPRGIVA